MKVGGRNQGRRQGKLKIEGIGQQDSFNDMHSNVDSPRSNASISQRNPALPGIHDRSNMPRGRNGENLNGVDDEEGSEIHEIHDKYEKQDQKLRVKVISAAGIDPGEAEGIYVKMRLLEADSTVQALEAYTSTCDVSAVELYW
jgi:hypothetical protein